MVQARKKLRTYVPTSTWVGILPEVLLAASKACRDDFFQQNFRNTIRWVHTTIPMKILVIASTIVHVHHGLDCISLVKWLFWVVFPPKRDFPVIFFVQNFSSSLSLMILYPSPDFHKNQRIKIFGPFHHCTPYLVISIFTYGNFTWEGIPTEVNVSSDSCS